MCSVGAEETRISILEGATGLTLHERDGLEAVLETVVNCVVLLLLLGMRLTPTRLVF